MTSYDGGWRRIFLAAIAQPLPPAPWTAVGKEDAGLA